VNYLKNNKESKLNIDKEILFVTPTEIVYLSGRKEPITKEQYNQYYSSREELG